MSQPQTNTDAADRLREALGENATDMLLDLINQVKNDNHGWGDVVIVIAEHRIAKLRVSFSYQPIKDVID